MTEEKKECPFAHSVTAYYECPYSDKHGHCKTYVCMWHDESMECARDMADEYNINGAQLNLGERMAVDHDDRDSNSLAPTWVYGVVDILRAF